jgi:hypothetical protein
MPRTWTTRKSAAVVAACAIGAAAFLYLGLVRGKTANASPVPDLLSALPSGAPTLIYVDLAAVRASSFYQHRPDKGPIAIPNQDYADFIRSTGFDFEKDLDRVVIATWPPSGTEQRKNIVIAEGRFDRAKIRDYALRQGKLDHQQGHEVFEFPASSHVGSNSLAFLDDHRIAMIEGPSIAPLLDAHSGDSAADPARERAARVDGAAAFAIARVPPVPDNFSAGGAQSAQLASLARSVQWVTLAARPEGDDLRISLEGECDTTTSAMQLKAALEILRMLGRAGLESPKTRQSMNPAAFATLQNLLSGADVTQTAERVRILIELTPDIFKLSEKNKTQ